MNEYYADEDVFFEDDEPLTPEEQARADRAYYQQQIFQNLLFTHQIVMKMIQKL